jgi:hypothetical protein
VLQKGATGMIWIYRYYDLQPRHLPRYGGWYRSLDALITRQGGHEGVRPWRLSEFASNLT